MLVVHRRWNFDILNLEISIWNGLFQKSSAEGHRKNNESTWLEKQTQKKQSPTTTWFVYKNYGQKLIGTWSRKHAKNRCHILSLFMGKKTKQKMHGNIVQSTFVIIAFLYNCQSGFLTTSSYRGLTRLFLSSIILYRLIIPVFNWIKI